MSKVFIEEASLTAIGNAIRAKTGGTEMLTVPSGMVDAIASITTGGGSGDEVNATEIIRKLITHTYEDAYIDNEVTEIADYAFYYQPIYKISSTSLQYLNGYAFNNSGLRRMDLPALINFKPMQSNVFSYCYYLREVDLPSFEYSTDYCNLGFGYCNRLISLKMPKAKGHQNTNGLCGYSQYVENVYLPQIKVISMNNFKDNRKLHAMVLPETCTSIKNNAFYGCNGLRYLVLKSPTVVALDSVGAFSSCSNLTIFVPDDLVDSYNNATNWSALYNTLGMSAGSVFHPMSACNLRAMGHYYGEESAINTDLAYSWGLTGLELPNVTEVNYSEIDSSPFKEALYLAYLKLANATVVGGFDGCSGLKIVHLPKVQTINANAFNGCAELRQIDLPASLTSIGANAFTGCFQYSDREESFMILRSTTPVSIDATAFNSIGGMHLYVPAALVSHYQAMGFAGVTVAAIEDNPIQCA